MRDLILSVDIETYGARTSQTYMDPLRSRAFDGRYAPTQILTVAVTRVRGPSGPPSLENLAQYQPLETRVFDLGKTKHLEWLTQWLERARIVLMANPLFDLLYLHAHYQALLVPFPLKPLPWIVDVLALAYLEYDVRPERGLKALCNLYGLTWETTLKDGPLRNSDLRIYNAQDTYNTALLTAYLARDLLSNPAQAGGLAPIEHFQKTIEICFHMALSGPTYSKPALQAAHDSLTKPIESLRTRFRTLLSDILEDPTLAGPNSQKTRHSLLDLIVKTVPEVLDDELLTYTEVNQQISLNAPNQQLLSLYLAKSSHPRAPTLAEALKIIKEHDHLIKIRSTYTSQYLDLVRTPSTLVPSRTHPLVLQSMPSWNYRPSPSGGAVTGRMTCKNGPHQTEPPLIQKTRCPRSRSGILISLDADQCELRTAAVLSGEQSLADSFLHGTDLHTDRAIQIWGLEALRTRYPELQGLDPARWKKACPAFAARERQVGKRVNFADLFRAGARKMRDSVFLDIGEIFPLELFTKIVRDRPCTRPNLTAYQDRLIQEANENGGILLPVVGHFRHFAGGDAYEVNKIVNTPIQTLSAYAIIHLQHRILGDLPPTIRMVLNVFDAIYFDLDNPEELPLLKEITTDAIQWLSTEGLWGKLHEHCPFTIPFSVTWSSPMPSHPDRHSGIQAPPPPQDRSSLQSPGPTPQDEDPPGSREGPPALSGTMPSRDTNPLRRQNGKGPLRRSSRTSRPSTEPASTEPSTGS